MGRREQENREGDSQRMWEMRGPECGENIESEDRVNRETVK